MGHPIILSQFFSPQEPTAALTAEIGEKVVCSVLRGFLPILAMRLTVWRHHPQLTIYLGKC